MRESFLQVFLTSLGRRRASPWSLRCCLAVPRAKRSASRDKHQAHEIRDWGGARSNSGEDIEFCVAHIQNSRHHVENLSVRKPSDALQPPTCWNLKLLVFLHETMC